MAKIQKKRGDCIRYSLHSSRVVGKLPIVVETSNFKTPRRYTYNPPCIRFARNDKIAQSR